MRPAERRLSGPRGEHLQPDIHVDRRGLGPPLPRQLKRQGPLRLNAGELSGLRHNRPAGSRAAGDRADPLVHRPGLLRPGDAARVGAQPLFGQRQRQDRAPLQVRRERGRGRFPLLHGERDPDRLVRDGVLLPGRARLDHEQLAGRKQPRLSVRGPGRRPHARRDAPLHDARRRKPAQHRAGDLRGVGRAAGIPLPLLRRHHGH